jgi:hypothetical protein
MTQSNVLIFKLTYLTYNLSCPTTTTTNMSLYRDDKNDVDHHNNITTPGNDNIGSNNNNNYRNNNTEESLKYELYENDYIDGRIFLQLLSNNENLTIMNQFKLECINRLCHIYGKMKVINKNNDKINFISYECSMELANKYNIHHYNYHDTTFSKTAANTTGMNTIDHKLNDINIPSYLTPIYGSELIVSEFNSDCPIDSIKFIIINCAYNSNTYKYYNNSNIINNNNNNNNDNNIFNQNNSKSKNVCIIKTIINYKSIHDIIIPISSSSSSSRNIFNATHTNYKIIEVLFDKMTIFRSKIILPSKNSQFNHEIISQSPNQFIPYKLPTPIYISRLSRSSSFSLVNPSSLTVTSSTSTTPPTSYITTTTSTTNPSINTPTSSSSTSTSTTTPCNNSKQSRQISIRIINYLTYLCKNKLLEFFLSFLIVIIWLIIRSNYIRIRLSNNHINNIMISNNSKYINNINNNNNNTSNIDSTLNDYQYFMTISIIIMITSWIIIFTFRNYILVYIKKSLHFLPKLSSVSCTVGNGKVFFVNGWNAWSYCGAVLQGMEL